MKSRTAITIQHLTGKIRYILARYRGQLTIAVMVISALASAVIWRGFSATAKTPDSKADKNEIALSPKTNPGKKSAEVASNTLKNNAITARPNVQTTSEYRPGIRIWVQPDGVHPPILHASPGKLRLNVENGAPSDITVIVNPLGWQTGQPHSAVVTVKRADRRNHLDLELGPGEYVFYEQLHPAVTGKLTVATQL